MTSDTRPDVLAMHRALGLVGQSPAVSVERLDDALCVSHEITSAYFRVEGTIQAERDTLLAQNEALRAALREAMNKIGAPHPDHDYGDWSDAYAILRTALAQSSDTSALGRIRDEAVKPWREALQAVTDNADGFMDGESRGLALTLWISKARDLLRTNSTTSEAEATQRNEPEAKS